MRDDMHQVFLSRMTKNVARRLNFTDSKEANNADTDMEKILVESITSSSNEARDRWNFDFKNENPLEGNWEWSAVKEANADQSVEENTSSP